MSQEYDVKLAEKKIFSEKLKTPPEGIISIEEYIALNDGHFNIANLIDIIRESHTILDKILQIAPDLVVDIESAKQDRHCMSCVQNITAYINGSYSDVPIFRQSINELICSEPLLLSAIREINNILKRHQYLIETVHHVPKKIGAWGDFIKFMKNERIRFSNMNIIDPGPQSQTLHVYIVPSYKPLNLI